MAKKKRPKSDTELKKPEVSEKIERKPAKFSKILFPALLAAFLGIVAAVYFYNKSSRQTATNFKVGATSGCQQVPPFVRSLGFGNRSAFSTSDRKMPGLILTDGERKYQHPSWKAAGSLAPITRDGKGNVFVAPAPFIDVLKNKPEEQNKVFRVDAQSQEMKQFADLPRAAEPSSQNAYGVLGLTFDCDTNSIYASSLAGSTRDKILGSIFQISADGKVLSRLENVDAIGLAVFNSAKGKRLYFGMARDSEIWSVGLDANGNFSDAMRKEFSMREFGTRGDDKARRINFKSNEMIVFGVEFNFNLIAPTEKQETVYRFRYDTAKDFWNYVPEPPQIVGEKPTNDLQNVETDEN